MECVVTEIVVGSVVVVCLRHQEGLENIASSSPYVFSAPPFLLFVSCYVSFIDGIEMKIKCQQKFLDGYIVSLVSLMVKALNISISFK